ncbi:hypothetical protein EGM88_09680 [Aureibaculum marinum]|uniref:DUF4595 domain-containing protein n=1 Tax=Aureibaculum marinum TaxID=2487930 RepID=A0A3N4PAS5_9FLAO|nr:hypothetical protein [Aureibaculum marinum]RPD96623.1 hypothetical protein EGM88_09680 [Aureibaculum marinum]
MKTKNNTKNFRVYLILVLIGLISISCNQDTSDDDLQQDPEEEHINNEILDLDAKGSCKTVKMIVVNGEIRNSYTINYNAEDKITQAIGDFGKYTFEQNSEGYFFSSYNASGILTNTKDVKLNSSGKPVSFVETIMDDKGKPYREQLNEITYVNGKLSELKVSEDGYQIRLYRYFWNNGNITEIEDNGIIERRYEYYSEHKYPTDGLIGVDFVGFLQTGIILIDGNTNLMKYSKVDTIISDFTYQFNEHGKIVSQKIIRNDLSDPIYFTPTYNCE